MRIMLVGICAAVLVAKCAAQLPDLSIATNNSLEVDNLFRRDVACPVWPYWGPPTPDDFYLRILPLGASIVWGYRSSDNNGFRKRLRDTLRQDGWKVNMVGSLHNGDMIDNNVDAKIGNRIDQVHAASASSTMYQPNVILINAGTNDCLQAYDIPNAGARYGAMLDDLYNAIPGVTIVVSTVLIGSATGIPQYRDSVNSQLRNLVAQRLSNGQKIVLVDTDQPASWLTINYIGDDGIHPTDAGYERLAALMRKGIYEGQKTGFLSAPAETQWSDDGSSPGDNTCDKVYGNGHGPVNTQQGSGLDDGPYVHDSESMGSVATIVTSIRANFTFARIANAFGAHDLLEVTAYLTDDGSGRYYNYYPNDGNGSWTVRPQGEEQEQIIVPDACIAKGVRFVDINADGLDDMICVAVDGTAYAMINNGNRGFTNSGEVWKASEGPKQDRVLLADIDGDGRADYCTIADNGDISCWRNGGQGNMPEYWQELGVVVQGKGFGDVNGVRFFDLNGDGRHDWMWMDDTGKTWTYTNNRACSKGTLEPLWRAGSNKELGEGPTHAGMGKNVGRSAIHFANVFNEPESIGLYGRGDYIWMREFQSVSQGQSYYLVNVWKNTGSGATKLKADGDKYCNMMGHSPHAMDYVWVHSTGWMMLYESLGGTFPVNPPYWGPHYQIWAATDYTGAEIDRRDLHLADWDGDGLCDIIYVNPDDNSLRVWLNLYKVNGNFDKWTEADVSAYDFDCPEKRGVGIYDLAVRFADLDGNGRTDILCIKPNGFTSGCLNNADGPEYVLQIKKSEDKDRANFHWADVNGDGRADLLWVDKFNGDGYVYYNQGETPVDGSLFTWEGEGAVYMGNAQGSCMHYPDLDGDGRADMHVVDSLENTAQTWFNLCPNEGSSSNGDDPDTFETVPVTWLGLT
ncbi:hypothetical protein CI102_13335 [Trichoderma harzianum]|nr:hypothetical protein CI102_13335 [Trichoderma harzianum]